MNEIIKLVQSPIINELNKKYCVVRIGGKTRVMRWKKEFGRLVPEYDSFEDFRNFYMNRSMKVGKRIIPLGKWWLEHPDRRQYDGVVYRPDVQDEVVDGCLNLWTGFAIEPKQGDWSLMQQHIKEVIADGDEKIDTYFRKWGAWTVQHPGVPAETALVMIEKKGAGKGLFGRTMSKFFGQQSFHISNTEHLVGKHNFHLQHCSLLFADEAYWPGDRSAEGVINRLITEDTLTIEPKFVGAFQVQNCLHIIIASNEKWVVPAGLDERRYVASKVNEKYKQNEKWFTPLYKQLDNGGREAMLYDLLNMDLGDWHPRRIIQTAALQDQKLLSLDAKMRWWVDILNNRQLVYGGETANVCPKDALYDHYVAYVKKSGGRYTDSNVSLGMFLHDVAGPNLKNLRDRPYNAVDRYGTIKRKGWVYAFPPLKDCRERVELMGLQVDWMAGSKTDGEVEDKEEWVEVERPETVF